MTTVFKVGVISSSLLTKSIKNSAISFCSAVFRGWWSIVYTLQKLRGLYAFLSLSWVTKQNQFGYNDNCLHISKLKFTRPRLICYRVSQNWVAKVYEHILHWRIIQNNKWTCVPWDIYRLLKNVSPEMGKKNETVYYYTIWIDNEFEKKLYKKGRWPKIPWLLNMEFSTNIKSL